MLEAAVSGSLAAIISTISAYLAAKAVKQTRPVSNGFAGNVLASLEHMKSELHYLRQRVDSHVDNHP